MVVLAHNRAWPQTLRSFYGLITGFLERGESPEQCEPDGVVWAKSTVNLFLNDLARDNSVRALNDEYKMYFGALAPATGISVQ